MHFHFLLGEANAAPLRSFSPSFLIGLYESTSPSLARARSFAAAAQSAPQAGRQEGRLRRPTYLAVPSLPSFLPSQAFVVRRVLKLSGRGARLSLFRNASDVNIVYFICANAVGPPSTFSLLLFLIRFSVAHFHALHVLTIGGRAAQTKGSIVHLPKKYEESTRPPFNATIPVCMMHFSGLAGKMATLTLHGLNSIDPCFKLGIWLAQLAASDENFPLHTYDFEGS